MEDEEHLECSWDRKLQSFKMTKNFHKNENFAIILKQRSRVLESDRGLETERVGFNYQSGASIYFVE